MSNALLDENCPNLDLACSMKAMPHPFRFVTIDDAPHHQSDDTDTMQQLLAFVIATFAARRAVADAIWAAQHPPRATTELGATMVEYAIVVSLIAAVSMAVIGLIGLETLAAFTNVNF